MKHEIDKLIANILLDEGEVYLPDFGTLIMVRCAATRLSSRLLQRPYFELRFTGEKRGLSIVEHLVIETDISHERAESIYAEYLSQSVRNGVLTVSDVCIVANGRVQMKQKFEDMVNPYGRNAIKINPHTNYAIYVVATLCALFALGVAGYVLYSNGSFASDKKVVAKQTTISAESQKPAAEPAAEPIAEPTVQPEAEPSPQSIGSDKAAVRPMKRGCSYAVWGVYNELKNAKDAVAWLGKHYPSLEACVYDYDERYMVALCELPSRSECGRRVTALKSQAKSFKSVWVYTR